MHLWIILITLSASLLCLFQVEAAECAEICYTTELTGFGPGGIAGCACSGLKPTRSGPGNCNCGQCYEETNGAVIGYAVNSDGTCAFGTNCGDCTFSADASSSKTTASSSSLDTNPTTPPAPPTSTPPTSTPPTTTSVSSTAATTDAPAATSPIPSSGTLSNGTTGISTLITDSSNSLSSSGSDDNNADKTAGSSTVYISNDNGPLKTWQIALIICCGVLVFTVAVVSVLSCYCKARNRLYENEDNLADASYYQQQHSHQHGVVVGSDASTLFPAKVHSHQRSGSSGSLTNEMKPLYANSTNSGSSDRLGMGFAPVHMRRSTSGDRSDVASNSYRNVEPRYSKARDRGSLAVEL
ncbi:unnamed protein product [Peronospora belbahrii]|uniref:Uncharacterized protein n=1 Tax=Peronospora belbahrii TaxID=622444 RepID=A0AAU9KSI1_9STRA|nr:unnamed protein product [Peronospora belbahrii]CAH0521554.1 unnamed protein product [Peronospora belbahrii]